MFIVWIVNHYAMQKKVKNWQESAVLNDCPAKSYLLTVGGCPAKQAILDCTRN